MSEKLSKLRVVRVNDSTYFVVERRGNDGGDKTFADIRREFKRYEGTDAETIKPVAFTDKFNGTKECVADIIEAKEFTGDDLPFVL